MEMANQAQRKKITPPEIRVATKSDAAKIMELVQFATHRHVHVDWYLPGDWIGSPSFLLQVQTEVSAETLTLGNRLFDPKVDVQACLAITADPPPAAWVRITAVKNDLDPQQTIQKLLHPILNTLKKEKITQIGWLAIDPWPNEWLAELGFKQENAIITYRKTDVDIPEIAPREDLIIRPVERDDLPHLAEIERVAFEPLWRHSAHALQMAQGQAFSFDVVLYKDLVVGFQLSARGQQGVHLARMTIDPAHHGKGIGSLLLAHAFAGYHQRGLSDVSLNTPMDNTASKMLYEKFGFVATEDIFPVWVMNL